MFDFNGDGKVDAGEEYMAFRICEDMNDPNGVFSGRSGGADWADKLASFLVYALVLAPVISGILFFKWLTEVSPVGGSVVLLIVALAALGWLVVVNVKESRRKKKEAELKEKEGVSYGS